LRFAQNVVYLSQAKENKKRTNLHYGVRISHKIISGGVSHCPLLSCSSIRLRDFHGEPLCKKQGQELQVLQNKKELYPNLW